MEDTKLEKNLCGQWENPCLDAEGQPDFMAYPDCSDLKGAPARLMIKHSSAESNDTSPPEPVFILSPFMPPKNREGQDQFTYKDPSNILVHDIVTGENNPSLHDSVRRLGFQGICRMPADSPVTFTWAGSRHFDEKMFQQWSTARILGEARDAMSAMEEREDWEKLAYFNDWDLSNDAHRDDSFYRTPFKSTSQELFGITEVLAQAEIYLNDIDIVCGPEGCADEGDLESMGAYRFYLDRERLELMKEALLNESFTSDSLSMEKREKLAAHLGKALDLINWDPSTRASILVGAGGLLLFVGLLVQGGIQIRLGRQNAALFKQSVEESKLARRAIEQNQKALDDINKVPKIEELTVSKGGELVSDAKARLKTLPSLKVIVRIEEAKQVMRILARGENANVFLNGLTGVGKKEVMKAVALLIASNDPSVPEALRGKKIFMIDTQKLISGTGLRGSFGSRLTPIKEAMARGDIVYIPELARQMSGGASSMGEAEALCNLLLQILEMPESRFVGDGQPGLYQALIDSMEDYDRRLEKLDIAHLHVNEIHKVMQEVYRRMYQIQRNLIMSDATVEAATRLGIAYRNRPESSPFDPAKNALLDAISFAQEEAGFPDASSETKVNVTPEHVVRALEQSHRIQIDPDAGRGMFDPVSRSHDRLPFVELEDRINISRNGGVEITLDEIKAHLRKTVAAEYLSKKEGRLEKYAKQLEKKLSQETPEKQKAILEKRASVAQWVGREVVDLIVRAKARAGLRKTFLSTDYGNRVSQRKTVLVRAVRQLHERFDRLSPEAREIARSDLNAWVTKESQTLKLGSGSQRRTGAISKGRRGTRARELERTRRGAAKPFRMGIK